MITKRASSAILIVEDDFIIRWAGAEAFADAGFEVLEAANAQDALSLLEAHGGVNVLMTDIDMPGPINGLELARIAARRWPWMHIIVASGGGAPMAKAIPARGRFIPKPYEPEKIVRDVDALLAA